MTGTCQALGPVSTLAGIPISMFVAKISALTIKLVPLKPRVPPKLANRSVMASAKPTIEVEVWSDLACPWCYVGQRKIQKAVEQVQDTADVSITWHAFLLDPNYQNAHPEGEPLEPFYRAKFGANADAIKQRLLASGKSEGATFSNWQWRPNTFPGHRLVALARQHGRSNEANAALFKKSYEEGKNISLPEILEEVGRELGLPEVEEWVRSDEGSLEVLKDDAEAKRR